MHIIGFWFCSILQAGNIPKEIGNLTMLQTLDLGGNNFSGEILQLDQFLLVCLNE